MCHRVSVCVCVCVRECVSDRACACVKAKFHYASWFEAGLKLVAD